MTSKWREETLVAARREGDAAVDPLVAGVLEYDPAHPKGKGIGRLGYNHMLDLADTLVANPALALVETSLLRVQLEELAKRKPEIVDFFDPIAAPDWVDENKLARAAELWETDAILSIAALYAASLPACYLMKKGVPALYNTDKLADAKYVFQRIHETGLMLEAVLSPDGIKVIHDVDLDTDERMANVLNQIDQGGDWQWSGHKLRRGAGERAVPPDIDEVRRRFEAVSLIDKGKRYLWGPGYIAARKVRFLHSAMRFMLQFPQQVHPIGDIGANETPRSFAQSLSQRTAKWDEDLGVPINQEDMAFVLLTFGYLIPKAMGNWGRHVPRDQKEAFLHLWKVIGYVMGIRVDLMTDDLDEAEALYEQILARNAGGSPSSMILTNAVMNFLGSYLPARWGLDQELPAALIIDQLGPDMARLIVPTASYDAALRFGPRVRHSAAKLLVRGYYLLRDSVLCHVPVVSAAMTQLTNRSAQMLIASWRDAFRRRPFYVPADATSWVRERGVTPEFEQALLRWRRSLFDVFLVATAALIVGGVFFCVALGLGVERIILGPGELAWLPLDWVGALAISAVTTLISALLMGVTLPARLKERPQPN